MLFGCVVRIIGFSDIVLWGGSWDGRGSRGRGGGGGGGGIMILKLLVSQDFRTKCCVSYWFCYIVFRIVVKPMFPATCILETVNSKMLHGNVVKHVELVSGFVENVIKPLV